MYTYPLKALSKDEKEEVVFSIGDGPCHLEDNLFILTRRPGTPILQYNTIVRGMDVAGLFEGDVLEYKGDLYTVIYSRGFRISNKEKGFIRVENMEYINVVSNIYKDSTLYIQKRLKHTYRWSKYKFSIESVMTAINDDLIVNLKGGMSIPIEDVRQYAGITHEGKKMYFGDLIDGYPLILHNGRCALKLENEIKEIINY